MDEVNLCLDKKVLMQQAFFEWQETFPAKHFIKARDIMVENKDGVKRIITELAHFEGACCQFSHYTDRGDEKPEHMVCSRERAWRKYVAIRDSMYE